MQLMLRMLHLVQAVVLVEVFKLTQLLLLVTLEFNYLGVMAVLVEGAAVQAAT